MATLIFCLYSLAHFAVAVFALRILRRYAAPGALIIAVLSVGLVYDNGIVALGSSIGIGDTLERLSWPRFILHALVTPVMIVRASIWLIDRLMISSGVCLRTS